MPHKTLGTGWGTKGYHYHKIYHIDTELKIFIFISDAHVSGFRLKKMWRLSNALGLLFVNFLRLYSTCSHNLTHNRKEPPNK